MFKLATLIPTRVLHAVYARSFAELVKRGILSPLDEDWTTTTQHGDYQVKLYTEQDASYTTTWAIYKGDDLVYEGADFHSSMGEAESSAIEWIDNRQLSAVDGLSV